METERYILLEPDSDLDDFIILHGIHDSSSDFYATKCKWEAIAYDEDELNSLSNNENNLKHQFWSKVKFYLLDDTKKYKILFENKDNL